MAEVAALEVRLRTQKARREAAAVQKSIRGVGTASSTAAKRVKASSASMQTSMTGLRGSILSVQTLFLGLGVGLGFGATIRTIKDFEFAMSRVKAISRATNVEFQALSATARRMGASTVFSATEAAEGLRLLAQAGFTAGEAIDAIEGTLNLAIAGALDLATASSITANAIRGFRLEANEAGRVADVLAVAATNSNTTVAELGEALKFVAPVAAATGQSIEAVAAAVGVLSDAGLKGTLAGTGLRRVLIGLTNVTPVAQKALKRLGLTVQDVNPATTKLVDILQKMKDGALGASEAFDLFGLRGGPAILTLVQNVGRFKDLQLKIDDAAGAAKRIADIMQDNLRGSFLLLRSAIEEATLQIGDSGFTGSLRELVETMTGVVKVFSGALNPLDKNATKYRELAETIKNFGKAVLVVVGGSILGKLLVSLAAGAKSAFALARGLKAAAAVIRSFIPLVAAGIGIMSKLRLATLGASGAFAALRVAISAHPIGLLFNAVTLAAGAWFLFADGEDDAKKQARSLNEQLDDTVQLMIKLREAGLEGGEASLPILQGRLDAGIAQANQLQAQIERQKGLIADLKIAAGKAIGQGPKRLARDRIDDAQDKLESQLADAVTIGDKIRIASRGITDINAKTAGLAPVRALAAAFDEESLEGAKGSLEEQLAEAGKKAKKIIANTRFKIEQIELGQGVEADLQRFVNEGLRASTLDDLIPPALEEKIKIVNASLLTFQEQLEKAKAGGRAADIQQQEDNLQGAMNLNGLLQEQVKARGVAAGHLKGELASLFEVVQLEKERQADEKAAAAATETRINRAKSIILETRTEAEKLVTLEAELLDLKDRTFLTQEDINRKLVLARAEGDRQRLAEKKRQADLAKTLRRDSLSPIQRGVEDFQKSIGLVEDNIERLTETTLRDFNDALVSGLLGGADAGAQLLDVFRNLGERITGLLVEELVTKPIIASATQGISALKGIGTPGGLLGGSNPLEDKADATTAAIKQADTNAQSAAKQTVSTTVGLGQIFATGIGGLLGLFSIVNSKASTAEKVLGGIALVAGIGSSLLGSAASLSSAKPNIPTGTGSGPAGGSLPGGGVAVGADLLDTSTFGAGGISHLGRRHARVPTSAFANARRFQRGGSTGDNIPALLSRGEAVVPLSGGREIPVDLGEGAGTVINQVFNISTPDVESFRRNETQILARAGAATNRAVERNN